MFHPIIFPTMELFSVNKKGRNIRSGESHERKEAVSTKSRKEEEARGNARDSPRDRRTEDMRRARRKVATRLFIVLAVQTTLIEMRYLLEFKGDV